MSDLDIVQINKIKREILTACYRTREGHVASSYSILDILYVMYSRILDNDLVKSGDEKRDRFVLSKGHAAVGYYAVLKEFGYFDEPLDTMCAFHSRLGGHPDCNKVPGIEASTGSLGHGVPMAVGMALGLKIQKNPVHVYVLAGDGEINEGSVWEGLLIASHNALNNLTVIIDYNHSTDRAVDLNNLQDKLSTFGFNTVTINGHDHDEIENALLIRDQRPTAIICETIKGKGIAEMQNNPAWHHRTPTDEEYNRFLEELS